MFRTTRRQLLAPSVGAVSGGLCFLAYWIATAPLRTLVAWPDRQVLGGVLLIGLAALDFGRPTSSCGISRETVPWADRGWIVWSVMNSVELASALLTRPGVMILWAVVLGAASAPTWETAVIVGAVYGGLRCSGHLVLRPEVRNGWSVRILLGRTKRRRAAACLAALPAAAMIALGA